MKPRTIFLMVVSAAVVLLLGLSFKYQFRAALFPWIFGSLTLFLCLLQIYREMTVKIPVEEKEDIPGERPSFKAHAEGIAWILGSLPVIYILGFSIGLTAYCFLYFKLHGEKWLRSTWLSLMVGGFVYGGFQVALRVQLYPGLLFSILDWGS